MKKDDQIAAAIALRGMAKDGKFAVKNDEKGKAEGAIKEVSELLDKLVKAVKTAEGASRVVLMQLEKLWTMLVLRRLLIRRV